ncbi:hypothetical protein [Roseateles violae]|uniref:Outer membrane protein assembly factor BamE n=1 Tax=Roseateles violae TaxID=3058042 RepID=A0ABT8DWE3_9BURK|nr:hypothetical protein [Pelomonas sp. PFR6]MDN3921214.1 hypothetical protein [Pelomonas sp. PFR6]
MKKMLAPCSTMLAAALLLMAGCATQPSQPPQTAAPPARPQVDVDAQRRAEFDKSLDRWNGAKTQELQSKLGLPTSKSRQADGKLVWAYSKSTKTSDGATFSCVVRYLIDERSSQVVGHQIEGC